MEPNTDIRAAIASAAIENDGTLAAVNTSIENAVGLPNSHYHSAKSLAREKRTLFSNNWAGIAFGKDVPNKGDVMPVDFLGEPLLLVRDREGRIRVFYNACRHRGLQLVTKPQNTTGLVRCPYHAWCYSLSGELKQTPHAGGPGIHEHPALDKSRLGLIEVASHVFMDVVFVNLSGTAPAFESQFGTLADRWREFDRPLYHSGEDSCLTLKLACNWKLAVENYCESYHLPFIHPGLNAYSRLEDHENILGDGPWSGQLSKVYSPQLDSNGRKFSEFSGLSQRWTTQAEYLSVYPNVLMGVHKDHCFAIILEPLSHDRTRERLAIYYASQDMLDTDHADLRTSNTKLWEGVFVEDISVVEGMQRGRSGNGFDGGHFSPVMDEATHHFHRWVACSLAV